MRDMKKPYNGEYKSLYEDSLRKFAEHTEKFQKRFVDMKNMKKPFVDMRNMKKPFVDMRDMKKP